MNHPSPMSELSDERLAELLASSERATQTIASLVTELQAARAKLAKYEEAVKPFLAVPLHGTFGGPLVGLKAIYEDGSEMKHPQIHAFVGHEAVGNLRRAALTQETSNEQG